MTQLPSPIPVRPLTETRTIQPGRSLTRAAVATAIMQAASSGNRKDAAAIVRERWAGDDVAGALVTRTATGPATVATPSWAGVVAAQAVGDFVAKLAPLSAAAEVFARAVKVDLSGVGSLLIPVRASPPAAADVGWVAEGEAIPVQQFSLTAASIGPQRKLSCICAVTRQLAQSSAAEAVITQLLRENAALSLDATFFSNLASTTARPAGILAGIAAQTATAGGGLAGLEGDLGKLAGAIASAAGSGVVLVAAPQQAFAIRLYKPQLDVPVFATLGVAAGTVIMLDPGAIAVAYGAEPRFSASTETQLHMHTAPQDFSTGAGPTPVAVANIAAPVKSMFQTDCVALRMLLPAAWAIRSPGAISWVSGTTWG